MGLVYFWLCSTVVTYDVTLFRVRATIGIR